MAAVPQKGIATMTQEDAKGGDYARPALQHVYQK